MYLVYDVRGIQKYIFAVPKLKSIIGGSLIVEEFDHKETPQFSKEYGWTRIFTGGGRGLFYSENGANLAEFQNALIEKAHEHGLDIRLGKDETSEKMPEAVDLYPFVPLMEPGKKYPCALSGLWPVAGKKEIHPLIRIRLEKGRREVQSNQPETPIEDVLWELQYEESLMKIVTEKCGPDVSMDFFRNVTSKDEFDDPEEQAEAQIAAKALGNRNRWAVVCMDGNDMGRQLSCMAGKLKGADLRQRRETWFQTFSSSLSNVTRWAFADALKATVLKWMTENLDNLKDFVCDQTRCLILPFRPLILGGDDVTILCHSGWAMEFVKQMAEAFESHSVETANAKKAELGQDDLWPATGNRLTISAGVLFCKTSFPLSSALDYAENLLASAKSRFRETDLDKCTPSEPAVDWETLTETHVDSPAERRRREMWFRDEELGEEIALTDKPYTIEGLKKLETGLMKDLAKLPGSLRSSILPGLSQPWSLRTAFLASLGKRHPELWHNLGESGGKWWLKNERKTQVIDALTLLDEERRMEQGTI
ncbi:MAG: hypothetical protein K6C40_11250 [Thermoguttaceae bacterium]|nr:hypothetical protein [Thermoguttaceae bacterium]